jgi:hypothetical protein
MLMEPLSKFAILGAEEMNKVLAVGENKGFLLTLNSIAVTSGRFKMTPNLALSRGVDIKVRQVA